LQAQLLKAREDLREQATRDSLTHLWNRNSILEALSRELARGARESSPLGIVIVDLDHFKNINDNHGHPAGDAVLREAARRMQSGVRQYDSIGRYGGEEFLILLPNCGAVESYSQAERLRKQLTQADIRFNDISLRITASFGVTAAIPGQPWTAEGLVRKADEALYVAKNSGRNRVEILAYSAEPAPIAASAETAVVT
jgi:two-component system cell cycle response regulator